MKPTLYILSCLITTTVSLSAAPLGCFKDSVIRDLNAASFSSRNMTQSSCINFCTGSSSDSNGNQIPQGLGLPFAALQNGDTCYCGNSFGSYGGSGGSGESCLIPCVGNISQFCGGLLKNYVFKTFIPVPSAKGIGNCPTLAKFDVNNGNTIASENPLDRNDNVANVILTFLLFIFALVNTFLKFSKGLSDAELKRRKSRFGSSSRYSTYSSQSEESAKFEHVNANINKDGDLDYTRGKKESRISFTPSLPFNTRKTNSMIYALSNFKRENPQIQEEIQDENLKPELPDAQLSIKVIPEMNTLKSTDIVASNLNSNYQSMKAAKSLSSFTPPRSSRIKKKDTVVVIDGKVERLESFTPSRSNRIKKKETVIEIDDVERHKSFTPPKKPSKNQFKV